MKEKEIPYIIDFINKANINCVKFKIILSKIQEMMIKPLAWLKQIDQNELILNKDAQNINFINCTSKNLIT
jgi:hypothetical protein